MKFDILIFAFLLMYSGCIIGIIIKLLSFKAKIGSLIFALIIPFISLIMIIKIHKNDLKRKNGVIGYLKSCRNSISLIVRAMPMVSGVISVFVAKSRISIFTVLNILFTSGFRMFFIKVIRKSNAIEKDVCESLKINPKYAIG